MGRLGRVRGRGWWPGCMGGSPLPPGAGERTEGRVEWRLLTQGRSVGRLAALGRRGAPPPLVVVLGQAGVWADQISR